MPVRVLAGRRTILQVIAVIALQFSVSGCGARSGPTCFPVQGEVRLDGQPLAEAMVVFHPVDGDVSQIPRPLAYTGRDGMFELTTLQTNDGAPPGEYAITVELRELKQDGDQLVRDGKNLLPEDYRDPLKSGFKFTVEAEPNEVPVLHLKSN